jgi:CheY-like chemotaxis protein
MLSSALIVDDYRDLAEALGELLALVGVDDVWIETEPLVALARAPKHPFELALLDIRMPEMDGITLYRRLRELYPNATYLLMSGFVLPEAVLAPARDGALVVQKPFSPEILVQLVRGHGRPRARG